MSKKSSQKVLKKQEQEMPQGTSQRLLQFSKQLREFQGLHRVWINPDFQQFLLPRLKQDNKWLDPQDFKDDKEFQRAYNVTWARAKASDEIIELLQGADQRARDIQKRIERESKITPPSPNV